MDKAQLAVLESGVRWTTNILVELLNNYGAKLSPETGGHFRRAVRALGELSTALRIEAVK